MNKERNSPFEISCSNTAHQVGADADDEHAEEFLWAREFSVSGKKQKLVSDKCPTDALSADLVEGEQNPVMESSQNKLACQEAARLKGGIEKKSPATILLEAARLIIKEYGPQEERLAPKSEVYRDGKNQKSAAVDLVAPQHLESKATKLLETETPSLERIGSGFDAILVDTRSATPRAVRCSNVGWEISADVVNNFNKDTARKRPSQPPLSNANCQAAVGKFRNAAKKIGSQCMADKRRELAAKCGTAAKKQSHGSKLNTPQNSKSSCLKNSQSRCGKSPSNRKISPSPTPKKEHKSSNCHSSAQLAKDMMSQSRHSKRSASKQSNSQCAAQCGSGSSLKRSHSSKAQLNCSASDRSASRSRSNSRVKIKVSVHGQNSPLNCKSNSDMKVKKQSKSAKNVKSKNSEMCLSHSKSGNVGKHQSNKKKSSKQVRPILKNSSSATTNAACSKASKANSKNSKTQCAKSSSKHSKHIESSSYNSLKAHQMALHIPKPHKNCPSRKTSPSARSVSASRSAGSKYASSPGTRHNSCSRSCSSIANKTVAFHASPCPNAKGAAGKHQKHSSRRSFWPSAIAKLFSHEVASCQPKKCSKASSSRNSMHGSSHPAVNPCKHPPSFPHPHSKHSSEKRSPRGSAGLSVHGSRKDKGHRNGGHKHASNAAASSYCLDH